MEDEKTERTLGRTHCKPLHLPLQTKQNAFGRIIIIIIITILNVIVIHNTPLLFFIVFQDIRIAIANPRLIYEEFFDYFSIIVF